MSYDDLGENSKIKSNASCKKYKIDVFCSFNSNDNKSIMNKSSKLQSSFPLKNKTSKMNTKIICKKDFKFSKYHNLSKNALYDYQMEKCKQGLIDDAIKQMYYILNLIDICDNKMFIKCKFEEITDFIEYHKLMEENVQNLYKILQNSISV